MSPSSRCGRGLPVSYLVAYRRTHKKLDPSWNGMGPNNVTAGAFKATLGGESHMLIRPDALDGTPSAVHKLLEINGNNSKLWGGAYTNAKATKGLMVHGAPARKMSCAHYKEAVDTLTKSLSTYSPFQHGVGVTVTKLDNSKAVDGDTFVTLEIERTPMDLTSGLRPAETKATFTEDHLSAVNGSGSRGVSAAAVKETAAGFESGYFSGSTWRTSPQTSVLWSYWPAHYHSQSTLARAPARLTFV